MPFIALIFTSAWWNWVFSIPNQTINMESTGRNHLHPLVSMAITELIFMKLTLAWQLSVKNSYTKFCTNVSNDSAPVSGLYIFLSTLSMSSRVHWRHEFSLYTSKLRPHNTIFSWYPTNVNIYKQLIYLIRKSLNGFSSSAVVTCDHQHKIKSTWSKDLTFSCYKIILSTDMYRSHARSPGQLHVLWWCPTFVGPQYGTCFMSPNPSRILRWPLRLLEFCGPCLGWLKHQ